MRKFVYKLVLVTRFSWFIVNWLWIKFPLFSIIFCNWTCHSTVCWTLVHLKKFMINNLSFVTLPCWNNSWKDLSKNKLSTFDGLGCCLLLTRTTFDLQVRVEAFCWGAGTALGELPPYFVARAHRWWPAWEIFYYTKVVPITTSFLINFSLCDIDKLW